MSLLMQALRRAESAKKAQAGAEARPEPTLPAAPGAAPASASEPAPEASAAAPAPRAPAELTLEVREPTPDELAAANAHVTAAQEQEDGADAPAMSADQARQEQAAQRAAAPEPAPARAADEPVVDYFSGGEPPPRPVYVAPAQAQPQAPTEAPRAAPAPAPATPPAEPVATVRARPDAAQDQAAAQAALKAAEARNTASALFAAKQGIVNRRPLIIAAVGVLLLATAAGVFYIQLQGASTPAAPAQVAVLVPAPDPSAVPPADPLEPALDANAAPVPEADLPAPAVAPAVPAASTLPAATAAAVPRFPQVREEEPAAAPRPAPAAAARTRTAAAPPAPAPIEVRRNDGMRPVSGALAGAYQSYLAGDTAAARRQYGQVLQQEPDNRDALLGMAAVALRRGQAEEAGAFYGRLLELNPADPDAVAGMASVQQGDPAAAESRLKGVLAGSPDSGAALYALGNLYAQQARWSEAQQAYFRAVGSAPSNAAYAFNLAVSLDKLEQKTLALDYYRRALKLSGQGGAVLDSSTVSARIRQLEQDSAR